MHRYLLLAVCAPAFAFQNATPGILDKLLHSHYGDAFDTGPREKPWEMQGIGTAHFAITTKNPEVQKWFDQGNALLHSFFDYEAERSFRWCLKLEPDNAMAYWGLARARSIRGGGDSRAQDMIREAEKRKANASPREQLYIDALAAELLPDPVTEKTDPAKGKKILETLCVRYPDDMEARAMLALETLGGDRYGAEMVIREILAHQPDHPGAHHYRIHNWDYHEPEQALDSAFRYGEIAPGIGHALHMPGHIFAIVGMWNEAAISMDAATRREKGYMKETLTFPFNQWNYGHNRNYLSYIQEQLGMADRAIFGARQLIDAPLDPQGNDVSPNSSHSYGIAALARALVKFERWDDLLKENNVPWRDLLKDKADKQYYEARAWFGKGDLLKAEKSVEAHAVLKSEVEKAKGGLPALYEIQTLELKARLLLAKGYTLEGLQMMTAAAQKELINQNEYADPPQYPEALYNTLGEAYLNAKSPALAVDAFERGLDLTKNDLFSLSGLVRAYAALGERDKAEDAMGRLMFVTADADPGLAIIARATATGIKTAPRDSSPRPQRNYMRTSLEKFGPEKWEPYKAPALEVKDTTGKLVTLNQFKGKNVILVFYLGQECAHCMKQLRDIGAKKDDWEKLDAVVLAVSGASPEKNAQGMKSFGDLPIQILSDSNHVNAHRFHSYDDFEETELHSTILIDKLGRVHWARNGGDPFGDMAFLAKQVERMNEAGIVR
ncbi:MAG TPA: redoxin domain-containing protein [Bryobacteraceae bacterium]|nr:redoxin domain-containing protein [Bryobacteraceae bacterium]